MSSAHANGGGAGPLPLPGNLTLPSVPSSELPKLLSLDLATQLQQAADKKQHQPADAAANNAAAALLMSRQASDRAGPPRQADGAGPSSSRMRRRHRGDNMGSDGEDGSDEDRSSLTGEWWRGVTTDLRRPTQGRPRSTLVL